MTAACTRCCIELLWLGTKRLGRKRSECVCRLGVTLCNEGIVGGRDKAGDGIASDWDCEAVRGDGIVLFLKQQYLLTSRKKIKCQLHALQSFLQFHVSCRDIQDSGHVRNYLKSDSSTRVIGPAHNRKCRALFRIFELLTHGFCVSKVLFEINFVTI